MSKPTVFLSQPMHQDGIDLLKQHADVIEGVYHPVASDADIEAALAKSDAVVIRSMPLTSVRMDKAPRLKVVAKHGAGMDSIDIPAATERGIVVANSGDANAFAVAQHAVALMLAVQRDVLNVDRIVRAGGYQQREKMAASLGDLWDVTVGLVGFGNIGRYAAHMVGKGFNAKVLAFDPVMSADAMQALDVEKVDALPDLLARADIVSLHLPLNSKTRHLIGEAELAAMKPTAIIVNTSRGGIIDETALIQALKAGRIKGAGLDVFEQEPPPPDHSLFAIDKVILSPHIGGGSAVARSRTSLAAANAALAVLSGRKPEYFINTEVSGRTRATLSS